MITLLLCAVIGGVSMIVFKRPDLFRDFVFDLQRIRFQHEYGRFFTSGFIHLDYGHLLFNLFSFYSFAEGIELNYGPLHVVGIFVGSVVLANLFSYFWHQKEGQYLAAGASGGVSGIIYASFVLLEPGNVMFILLPIPIPDRLFGAIYLIGTTIMMKKGNSRIGHSAHLGGAISGLLLGFFIHPDLIFSQYELLAWIALPFIVLWFMEKNDTNRF